MKDKRSKAFASHRVTSNAFNSLSMWCYAGNGETLSTLGKKSDRLDRHKSVENLATQSLL